MKKKIVWLKNKIKKKENFNDLTSLKKFVNLLYDKGYSALDIFHLIKTLNDKNAHDFLFYFDKIRLEFRNEKVLMFIYCYFYFMRKNISLENILSM